MRLLWAPDRCGRPPTQRQAGEPLAATSLVTSVEELQLSWTPLQQRRQKKRDFALPAVTSILNRLPDLIKPERSLIDRSVVRPHTLPRPCRQRLWPTCCLS